MDKETLNMMKKNLENVADILYKGNTEQGIAAMTDILPHLSMMASEIQDEVMQKKLITNVLQPLLESMENRDGTMMADIITYELIQMVDEMM